MAKLVSIGEIIADSFANSSETYTSIGGAPLNLCAQVAKLGANAVYLSKVGVGNYSKNLLSQIDNLNIDKKYIISSKKENTSIAYINISESGERKFTFMRNKPCELNLSYNDYQDLEFENDDIFEFGSVALYSKKSRKTHDLLIKKAKLANVKIAFDPNLRFNLWNNDKLLRKIVIKYLKYVDILKISDDELKFVFSDSENDAIKKLFSYGISEVLLTRNKDGATLFLKNGEIYECKGYQVEEIDTTGAGDSCFGGYLFQILNGNKDYQTQIDFACKCGAYTCTKLGAISAMGTLEEINAYQFEKNV